MNRKKILSPCGLYCGVCGVYIAHKNNDQVLKKEMSKHHNCSITDIECEGCFSDNRFLFCRICEIRTCVIDNDYEGCHECDKFPCGLFLNNDEFSESAQKLMKRSVIDRRTFGTAKWQIEEEKRYSCPHCKNIVPRHQNICYSCNVKVEIEDY
ncbi:MAG: DUF3795 domain-containing protein [Desulfobacterales bacterium]|nr:DUF3795 domain-containing protein [Desulfobacterales bacterium]